MTNPISLVCIFFWSGNDIVERLIAPQRSRNCKTKSRSAATIRTGDIKGYERWEIDKGRVWKAFQVHLPVTTLLGLRRINQLYCSMSVNHRLEETIGQSFRACNQQWKQSVLDTEVECFCGYHFTLTLWRLNAKKVLDAETFASKSRIVPRKSCQMRGSSSELRARVTVTMSGTFCVCANLCKMKRKNQARSKSLIS